MPSIIISMNRLSIEDRAKIIGMLVEGNSLRATSRMADVSINTVTKLLVDVGTAAAEFHDRAVRNVKSAPPPVRRNLVLRGREGEERHPRAKSNGMGRRVDVDGDRCRHQALSELPSGRTRWRMGSDFMEDCASRIKGRVQLTTDGHKAYLEAVEGAFGMDIDFAFSTRFTAHQASLRARRYSPATCIGCDMKTVIGNPDPKHVSTSFVERQNLTMRMGMRRFTRLTNGFSKKLENHAHMVALHFLYYNFGRVHKTLRVTPAMEAGLADQVWSLEELVSTLLMVSN